MLEVIYRPTVELIPYANNARTHSAAQVEQVAESINEFGFTNPVLIDDDGSIIAGHGRVQAAKTLALDEIPTITLAGLTAEQKRAYIIADNQLALTAGWDIDILKTEIDTLSALDFDIDLLGFDEDFLAGLDGEEDPYAGGDGSAGSLAAKFLIPPFTVLNAREGWWQDRRRAWLKLGIKSEEGRAALLQERSGGTPEMVARQNMAKTSVFDPVLCELAYLWFSPPGGIVLDPFAGGSVRGIVASKLGRQYIGHELRDEQVGANRMQAQELCAGDGSPPTWIAGDSRLIDKTCADVDADFVFSCPPYADLEVYSKDPSDLSAMNHADFRTAYFEIIRKACARLRDDRFACFVVSEVRDKKGNYIDLVGDTVQAFRDAGLKYYNEAVLVTPTGSLPLRAGQQFSGSRKLGKGHQNVLVFVKGDGKRAATACGAVDISEDLFPEDKE